MYMYRPSTILTDTYDEKLYVDNRRKHGLKCSGIDVYI